MHEPGGKKKFIYQTAGVCPPEIHFEIAGEIVTGIRFVGGGCPGNAELVGRLINQRPVRDILPLLDGINCRNNTSCPQQLSAALSAAIDGRLPPADSFRLETDPTPREAIALIGELGGDCETLEGIIEAATGRRIETIYCLGNLTGNTPPDPALMRAIGRRNIRAVQGEQDWHCARGTNNPPPAAGHKQRDRLTLLPQAIRFKLAGKCGVAFYGDYLQRLPGYSDYGPFSLEINMVCGLTDFMRDESVFPALEAMTDQFEADIVVFSQPRRWGYWHVGDRHFISLGPAMDAGQLLWGLLRTTGDEICFSIENNH